MEHLVEDLFQKYHGTFQKLEIFKKIASFDAQDIALSEKAIAYFVENAKKYKQFCYPYISATMFMNFKRTGNRVAFEDVYFQKRRALNALILGEYLEQKGEYLDDIVNGIFSICEESAWQLPAHNTYIRDTPQLLLPDSTKPILDLFACETGALLATAYRLLSTEFDKISPFINKRILSELENRIITPYLSTHFWWMGNGDEPMCNWTIWCTQNILLTASQIPLEEDTYAAIVRKACVSTDYFLKEYGVDGCCDEGAQYYHHAGLCLFFTLYLLNQICKNAFAELWQNPKIKNMAEYICNVHVDDIYYINYADCSPIAGRAGIREFLFGKATHSDALCSFAALDFIADASPYIPDEINLSYRLLTLYHDTEIRQYAAEHPKQIPAKNVWYESVGIFIARSADTCLSVKAGNNDDSHNHNDTGSIILYHRGKPILIDVGVENYTLKTFSPQRYEIWSMQSGYHNLPTLNGCDQLPGAAFRATDVQVTLNQADASSSISMDIAKAYPDTCGITAYKREVSFFPHQTLACIRLHDEFVSDNTRDDNHIIVNLMSYEKPTFTNPTLFIGDTYAFRVSGVHDCQIEEIPITDTRLQIAWKHNIYRIRFKITQNTFILETTSAIKI